MGSPALPGKFQRVNRALKQVKDPRKKTEKRCDPFSVSDPPSQLDYLPVDFSMVRKEHFSPLKGLEACERKIRL